jgi:hypothetical protein
MRRLRIFIEVVGREGASDYKKECATSIHPVAGKVNFRQLGFRCREFLGNLVAVSKVFLETRRHRKGSWL